MADVNKLEFARKKAQYIINDFNLTDIRFNQHNFIKKCEEEYKVKIEISFADFSKQIFTQLGCNNETNSITISENHNKYTIVLNENIKSSTRRRFTLAHELGHIFLKHIPVNDVRARSIGNVLSADDCQTDQEANAFAAELLMPEYAVRILNKKLNLEEQSKIFDVSVITMASRLQTLGYL